MTDKAQMTTGARPRKRSRGRDFTVAQTRLIRKLLRERFTAPQIHEQLSSKRGGYTGTLRSVQRAVADIKSKDPTAPWALTDAEPDEARAVLDVLGYVLYATKGRIHHFTLREAEWIARVRLTAPGLPKPEVWRLAGDYMLREDEKEDSYDLDAILALTPPPGASLELAVSLAEQCGRLFGHLWPERDVSLPVEGQRLIERISFLKGFVEATAHPYALIAAQTELEGLEAVSKESKE